MMPDFKSVIGIQLSNLKRNFKNITELMIKRYVKLRLTALYCIFSSFDYSRLLPYSVDLYLSNIWTFG